MTQEITKPNIFDYATSELSQDAVICWILSFYNDKNSKLYNLAKELLSSFMKLDTEDNKIEIKQQFYKTDILLHFPNTKKVVIIEDKTYTSEHDEQISKYAEIISNNEKYKDCKIHIVYFKTGFYYDNDKLVEYKCQNKFDNFESIHGEDFLKILQKYKNIDTTLDMYIEYLDNLIKWYGPHEKFDNTNQESFWDWNVSKEYIAQYKLMREIFPENDYWKNKEDENKLYMVYSGSSFGRPWTEMKILKGIDGHSVFWRIDTDKNGPYLSLRYYDWYDKKNEEKREKHITEYQRYFESAEKACEVKEFCKVGKQENYFEATLIHIHIKDILMEWDKNKDSFIKEIRRITDKFIAEVSSKKE